MSTQKEICYACEQPATTKEHAPPSSFFPAAYRNQLITVPSCKEHNNENSTDVEYTRNVLTTMYGVNEVAEQHFADKSQRSLARNNFSLLFKSFRDITPVYLHGHQVGSFTVDTDRVKAVMKACVQAIHFRGSGTKDGWHIVLTNLTLPPVGAKEAPAALQQLYDLLSQINFEGQASPNPEVFHYGFGSFEGGIAYRMTFYGGFTVIAFAPA